MWKIEIMVEFVLILLAMGISATLMYYFKEDVKNFFTSVKRWFSKHKTSIASVGTVGVLLGAGGGSIVLDNMPTGYIPSEGIEDLVGAMTDGGTETHIAVTYQDGTNWYMI